MTDAEVASPSGPVPILAGNASTTVSAETIDVLVGDLVPDLFGYFLNRLQEREDAADAVADTLLVLWRKWRSVPHDREEARRFAFGIARRVLLTHQRGRRRRNELADRLRAATRESAPPTPSVDLELRDALARLSEKDREIVLLVAWEGFSVADAGRVIGLRADAARARYSRARARLRENLTPTS